MACELGPLEQGVYELGWENLTSLLTTEVLEIPVIFVITDFYVPLKFLHNHQYTKVSCFSIHSQQAEYLSFKILSIFVATTVC